MVFLTAFAAPMQAFDLQEKLKVKQPFWDAAGKCV